VRDPHTLYRAQTPSADFLVNLGVSEPVPRSELPNGHSTDVLVDIRHARHCSFSFKQNHANDYVFRRF
jgi:hypothetical protein